MGTGLPRVELYDGHPDRDPALALARYLDGDIVAGLDLPGALRRLDELAVPAGGAGAGCPARPRPDGRSVGPDRNRRDHGLAAFDAPGADLLDGDRAGSPVHRRHRARMPRDGGLDPPGRRE